jgi:hypothetical protein
MAKRSFLRHARAGIAKAKADGLGIFDMRAGAEKAQCSGGSLLKSDMRTFCVSAFSEAKWLKAGDDL